MSSIWLVAGNGKGQAASDEHSSIHIYSGDWSGPNLPFDMKFIVAVQLS